MQSVAGTPHRIAVLGGGSFGTALANVAAQNGQHVCLWMRDGKQVDEIRTRHRNSKYLGEALLSPTLRATTQVAHALRDAELVIGSVPSHSFADVLRNALPHLPPTAHLLSATKGFLPGGVTTLSRFAHQLFAEHGKKGAIGVLSGPNLADEIVGGHITGTVLATDSQDLLVLAEQCLQSRDFRIFTSQDVYGVELAGVLKNIYAIGFGVAAYLRVGNNTRGLLMTRSLAEMSHLATTFGADPLTFLGLAGVGDLYTTCASNQSRNFRLGYAVASGRSLAEVQREMHAEVEGIETLRMIYEHTQSQGLALPIVRALYLFVFQGQSLQSVLSGLLTEPHGRV